jgi:hypothetical protein
MGISSLLIIKDKVPFVLKLFDRDWCKRLLISIFNMVIFK